MSNLKAIVIAKINKVIGLKGAVGLIPFTDIKDRIYKSKEFFLDENCSEILIVEKIEGDWSHLLCYFKNYDDIDKSKKLIGKFLYLPRIDKIILKDNELFYYELLEFKIEYLKGFFTYAKDIYISNEFIYLSLIIEEKEYIVPFSTNFIKSIDKENRVIELDKFELIEGNSIKR